MLAKSRRPRSQPGGESIATFPPAFRGDAAAPLSFGQIRRDAKARDCLALDGRIEKTEHPQFAHNFRVFETR